MEIIKEISKEVFENYVPAAHMPERNSSVFNRLQEQLAIAGQQLESVTGPDIDTFAAADESLKRDCLRFVCLRAFILSARSLDVVLTATGFGIVSTNSTAPASKVRVDALVDDCRLRNAEALDDIIRQLMRTEGWGVTAQARQSVQCLFWSIRHMREHTTLRYTADNWQTATGLALIADAFLRKTISTEYMDELMDKLRTDTLNEADTIIVDKCLRFTGSFISNYEHTTQPNQLMLDAIVEQLETYSRYYPAYEQSETYRGRRATRYRNRKEDPTFFFM